MDINVSHLLKSPVGTTREYDFDRGEPLPLDADIPAVIDGGHVRLDRTNTGILARGHVDATVSLACARCLEPVDVATSIDFAEEYEPSVDVTSGKPLPAPENDLVFLISPNHLLDLSEAVRQNLLAALPMQPLCRADCAGLCPQCGINRNTNSCNCVVEEENRPLAALADLLKESS